MSISARDRELCSLLEKAIQLPEGEARPFLRGAASDPELAQEAEAMLLARTGSRGFLMRPAAEALTGTMLEGKAQTLAAELAKELGPAESLGPYRILETLGRGGMGVVYRAEQLEPVRRQVRSRSSSPVWTRSRW